MTEAELEREISKVYRRAAEETTEKLSAYTKQFERLDKKWQADVKAGLKTKKEYDAWKKGKLAVGQRWEALNTSLATDVLKADNKARGLINDNLPSAFAEGFNFACYQMASSMGDSYMSGAFTLYDERAIRHIVKENPTLLPQLNPKSKTAEKIRSGKILQWNKQKINSEVAQGIAQGESMNKIAQRMNRVVGMNKNSAIRNARTATNGAHNAGKVDGFKDAQDMGINVEQMWLAALDDRTRATHRHLDGQIRKVGEKFEVDGYEIAYPCDPEAKPEMVYNCRCTLFPYLPEYDKGGLDLKDRDTSKMSQDDYEDWKQAQPTYNSSNPKDNSIKVPQKVKNREEAKSALKKLGFKEVRGTNKMDEKVLVKNTNRLAELNNRYGAIPSGMAFNTKASGNTIAYVSSTNGSLTPTSLNVNPKFFGSESALRRAVTEGTSGKNGRPFNMPVSSQYRDTAFITHEYGHILQQHIYAKKGIVFAKRGKISKEFAEASKKTAREIKKIAKESNPNFSLKKNTGKYANTNPQEFFAECFMNSQCGSPNEVGKAMLKWLKRNGL